MPRPEALASLPGLDLTVARDSLARLATTDALLHLEAALKSLQGLANDLRLGKSLAPPAKREMEQALLRFRTDLRHAGVLVEQGLAYCKDWTELLQPPASYGPSGTLRDRGPMSESKCNEFLAEA